jgi:hypothetical protein
VFTRTNGVWSPQGSKLVGLGGAGNQGFAVALSADGNTAIVGGPNDDSTGAVWVFTRSNGVWSPQGGKLVGLGGLELVLGRALRSRCPRMATQRSSAGRLITLPPAPSGCSPAPARPGCSRATN